MESSSRTFTRRSFIGRTVSAGVAVGTVAPEVISRRAFGANDRIRVGFIGVGNRGSQVMGVFRGFDDVEVAALADLYDPYLQRDRSRVPESLVKELGGYVPRLDENFGPEVKRFKDYRALLDQKDIDAVVIATPDHWHALQFIAACEAGKDVYVEKPLTATIVEGRKMIDAAKRYGRVVQVGLQRRSCPVYLPLPDLVRSGRLGKVTVARAYHVSNMTPDGIGRKPISEPPAGFDWDRWLGPRAFRPYQENIHPYRFRWWQDYSSQVGNWGVHYFDAIRWAMGETAPKFISAHGGKLAVDDDRTIPDTMQVTFEMPSGSLIIFGQYEAAGPEALRDAEIEIQGTLATLYSNPSYDSNAGYRVVPSGGGQFQDPARRGEPLEFRVLPMDSTVPHVRDFLDCMRSRRACRCPLEEGHRSTTFAHLANIALATKSRIEWDAEAEKIIHPVEANALLHYEYRAPWKLA